MASYGLLLLHSEAFRSFEAGACTTSPSGGICTQAFLSLGCWPPKAMLGTPGDAPRSPQA